MSTVKLYARVCQSSLIATPKNTQLAFFLLLASADAKGRVIGTDEALARHINFTLPEMQEALAILSAPDADSGSKLHDGRRLVKTEEPRGYKIVNFAAYQGRKGSTPADAEKCPTTPLAIAIAAIYRRKPSTAWADNEIAAFKRLMKDGALTIEDVELVHRYYEAERKKVDPKTGRENGFHRRDLSTFLNNYQGELDRARQWARLNPSLAKKAIATEREKTPELPLIEPPGFREWLRTTYPKSDHAQPYAQIPDFVRAEFKP